MSNMGYRVWRLARKRTGAVRRAAIESRSWIVAMWCLIAAAFENPIANAQYTYNPAAADEGPGIKYFGSAKDDNGALLPGASVQLISGNLTHMLVTDEQGRFRDLLGLDMVPEKVTLRCFKAGYKLVQVNKRPGPSAPKQTVQVDCILRAIKPH
jgi:hypothetical protein